MEHSMNHMPAPATDQKCALELTIRGCEVRAVFAEHENPRIYQNIRGVLAHVHPKPICIDNAKFFDKTAQK